MTARPVPTLVLAALLACGGPSAQAAATAPASAASAPVTVAASSDARAPSGTPAPAEGAAPPAAAKEAKVEHLVTEDSQVRIEEVRVRGTIRKIVVHSKIPGMGSYEIQPRDPGVDPQDDHAAGMRLFNFGF